MHNHEIKPSLQKTLNKLSKKDRNLYGQVINKIDEVINSETIEHYKNLRHDLSDFKRIHIVHFVLIFKFDKKFNLISFEDFEHHDKVYKNSFLY